MSPTWATMRRKASHLLASTHLGTRSSATSRNMVLMRLSLKRTWTLSKVSCVMPRRVKPRPMEDQRRRARLHPHLDDLHMRNRTQLHQYPPHLLHPLYSCRLVVHPPCAPPPLLRTRLASSPLKYPFALHLRLHVHQSPRLLPCHRLHHLHVLSQAYHPHRRRHRRHHLLRLVQRYLHRPRHRREEQDLHLHLYLLHRLLPRRLLLAWHRLRRRLLLHRRRHLRLVGVHPHPRLRLLRPGEADKQLVCPPLSRLVVRTSWHRFKEKAFILFARRKGPRPHLRLPHSRPAQTIAEAAGERVAEAVI